MVFKRDNLSKSSQASISTTLLWLAALQKLTDYSKKQTAAKMLTDCNKRGYQRTAAWNKNDETTGINNGSSKIQQATEGSHQLQHVSASSECHSWEHHSRECHTLCAKVPKGMLQREMEMTIGCYTEGRIGGRIAVGFMERFDS